MIFNVMLITSQYKEMARRLQEIVYIFTKSQ